VRLVYIDPPYATKSIFQSRQQTDAYSDLLEGAHYIEFLRARLILLRELLADDGSIYVHLDDNMAFHAKAIMDEVFGRSNFRNWITRKKCNPKNYTRKTFGNVSDYILFYTKTSEYVWHRPVEEWTAKRAEKEYQYSDEKTGRLFKKVPIHAPGVRNGETGKPWRGMMPPPGKHWQYKPSTLDEMDARGEIYWSPTGNPRRKIFLDESKGVPVQDIWLDFRDAHNQNIHITGYPTEKNPALLQQIIGASSDEGDLVLDCFAGSGTTLEVAHQMDRRWIGIDNSPEAIRVMHQRFASGLEPMGDFVNAKVIPTESEPDLFGASEEPPDVEFTREHTPITDFEMWKQAKEKEEALRAGK
jgi:adenine-specific DNA-methyltransferase